MKAKAATFLAVVLASAWAAQASASTARAVDTAHSTMTVYVYKEGLFSFAADDHEIAAPIVSGSVDETAGTAAVTVDATKMRVLDPGLGEGRRAQVQSNMTGPQVLDVKTYPTIAFTSKDVHVPPSGRLTLAGDLTLHGQTHPVSVDLTRVDATHFTGAAIVRQSTFGISPIRIAGGMVRVKDDVKVVFHIVLR